MLIQTNMLSSTFCIFLLNLFMQVTCPFLLDQFYWSERLHWLGVAPEPLQRQNLVPDNDDALSIHNAADVCVRAIRSALSTEIKAQASRIADRLSFEVSCHSTIIVSRVYPYRPRLIIFKKGWKHSAFQFAIVSRTGLEKPSGSWRRECWFRTKPEHSICYIVESRPPDTSKHLKLLIIELLEFVCKCMKTTHTILVSEFLGKKKLVYFVSFFFLSEQEGQKSPYWNLFKVKKRNRADYREQS